LRELHECHERDPACWAREPRAAPRNLRRAGVKVKPVCIENVKARRFKWLAALVPAPPDAPPRFPVRAALICAVASRKCGEAVLTAAYRAAADAGCVDLRR
jgi:hypothetical protein